MFDIKSFLHSDALGPAVEWKGYPKFNFIGGHNDNENIPVISLKESIDKVILSPVKPGASAEKSCIPPIPSNGSIAIAKTIIPIPPNQWVILLQKIILFGSASMSLITVDPVVVYPDIVSKKIFGKVSIESVTMYGIVPEQTIVNQPITTIK